MARGQVRRVTMLAALLVAALERPAVADPMPSVSPSPEQLPPFVVVMGPNVRGKALAVVADGTDRDKGEPCAVAQRAAAPVAVLAFCRSVD
jgi:hypothetical protein